MVNISIYRGRGYIRRVAIILPCSRRWCRHGETSNTNDFVLILRILFQLVIHNMGIQNNKYITKGSDMMIASGYIKANGRTMRRQRGIVPLFIILVYHRRNRDGLNRNQVEGRYVFVKGENRKRKIEI